MNPTLARAASAGASGLLLAIARPPFDVGPLAFVALVPLFVAWRDTTPRRRALLGFVAGVAYYAVLVSWAWYFGAVAIVPLVAVLAAYWAAVGAVVGMLDRAGLRSPLLLAAAWVVAEGVVARFPLDGLSWGEVGYALHDLSFARELASAGGVPLVSFVVVLVNAQLADILAASRIRPARPRAVVPLAATLGVSLVTVGLVAAADPLESRGTLRFALVQGNDKNRALTSQEKADRYLPRSHFDLARGIADPVDLIVFPESSMDEDPRADDELRREIEGFANRYDAWVLANATTDADDGRAVNLNLLYDPAGDLVGTYAKRHLVPYGEQVPWRSFLEDKISALERVPRDYKPGADPGLFDIAGIRVATVICFESAFAHEVRPLVRDGAEVIVVSTHNRSYRRSANSEQHVALGQMRAAETGRPVVHAAISGITAVIDADGRVVERTSLFERTVVESSVQARSGQTLYVRFGDWVLWCAAIAIAAGSGYSIRNRRRRSVESAPDRTGASA